MCGNFNHREEDDRATASGDFTASTLATVEGWRPLSCSEEEPTMGLCGLETEKSLVNEICHMMREGNMVCRL